MHDQSNPNDFGRSTSAMTGFMLGALVGAGIALLMAPATGVETRRRLGDAARRMRHDARDQFDRARGTLNELKDDARSAVEAGREAFQRTRQSHSQRPDSPMAETGHGTQPGRGV